MFSNNGVPDVGMLCWFQAGYNKIISDKVGIVIVARGAKPGTRLFAR